MSEEILPIDEMPHLMARLGKARVDRIRYVGQEDTTHHKHATNIKNTVIHQMQFVSPHRPGCAVTDILTGVAYMDTNQKLPLSVDRLFNVFQCISLVNTREIMAMMDIGERQARRYLRAVKFALPHLEKVFSTN